MPKLSDLSPELQAQYRRIIEENHPPEVMMAFLRFHDVEHLAFEFDEQQVIKLKPTHHAKEGTKFNLQTMPFSLRPVYCNALRSGDPAQIEKFMADHPEIDFSPNLGREVPVSLRWWRGDERYLPTLEH